MVSKLNDMKKNEIKLEGFQEWLKNEEVTFAYSQRENKRLIVNMYGGIKVMLGNTVFWEGTQPYTAIEKFNSITEKWANPLKDFKI